MPRDIGAGGPLLPRSIGPIGVYYWGYHWAYHWVASYLLQIFSSFLLHFFLSAAQNAFSF